MVRKTPDATTWFRTEKSAILLRINVFEEKKRWWSYDVIDLDICTFFSQIRHFRRNFFKKFLRRSLLQNLQKMAEVSLCARGGFPYQCCRLFYWRDLNHFNSLNFFNQALLKDWQFGSWLYRQLWRRPKAHFAAFRTLYALNKWGTSQINEKGYFSAKQKMKIKMPPRGRHLQNESETLSSTFSYKGNSDTKRKHNPPLPPRLLPPSVLSSLSTV